LPARILAPTCCRIASDGGGGCGFPVDPALDLPDAPVFWLPDEDTSVVILTPVPIPLVDAPSPSIGAGDQRIENDGVHGLHDLGDGRRIQILRPGESPDMAKLVAMVPLGLEGFDRIEAIHRLLAALHGRAIPPDTRLTRQQRVRLCRALRAFDGRRDGATQQEIAEVLFRIGSLDRDTWQASSARYAVMSLLRDARAMIAGGYRRLLRHRRRP